MAPIIRIAAPYSKSAATINGRCDRRWSRFNLAAASSGEPTEMMIPPTPNSSTHAAAVSKASAAVAT